MPEKCPSCGGPVDVNWKQCPFCGSELQKTGFDVQKTQENSNNTPKETRTQIYSDGQKVKYRINAEKIAIAAVVGVILLVAVAFLTMQNAANYYNEGLNLYNQGKYDEAIAKFDSALEIDPNNKEAYYLKGSSLDKIGRYSEAIASFDKAITIDPNYALAWQNKGLAQYKLKQFDEAIASFNKAKELGYTG